MTDHEKIVAWNNDHSGSNKSMFVTKLRHEGLYPKQILSVLDIIDVTCLHCIVLMAINIVSAGMMSKNKYRISLCYMN